LKRKDGRLAKQLFGEMFGKQIVSVKPD